MPFVSTIRKETPSMGAGVVAGAVAQADSATAAPAMAPANRRRVMDRNIGISLGATSAARAGGKVSDATMRRKIRHAHVRLAVRMEAGYASTPAWGLE
jgi:hypothetical protein